jgi:hypothetical protein
VHPNFKSHLKFVVFVSALSLLPFLIFFFLVVPCSDDIFYRNYAQDKSTWEFLVHHYNTWTGRYFSNLMMAINPFSLTSQASVYPWMMLSLFLFFFICLFFFFKTLIPKILNFSATAQSWRPNSADRFFESSSSKAFVYTLVTVALFLHKMPRTADSLYWFAGASSHLLPMSLILFAVAAYFRNLFSAVDFYSPETKTSMSPKVIITITLISVISFIVSGSNETLAIQWIFTLMFMVFYKRINFKRWDWTLYAPLIMALVGFLILYFAPGNAIRAKELKGGHDLLLLLIKPWGLILETTVRYISFGLLILILTFAPAFKKINANLPDFIKSKNSLRLLSLYGLGLFALTFVPSVWTMGGLPPRRVLNNMYLFFLLYGHFLLVISFHKLIFLERWSGKFHAALSERKIKLLFAASILVLFNNFVAWKDLLNSPKFLSSLEKRDSLVSSGKNTDLILPPLSYFPTTYFYEDITVKPDDYRNIVFAEYYKLKSVILSQNYDP